MGDVDRLVREVLGRQHTVEGLARPDAVAALLSG
jgi:hypothetical protein